MIDTPAGAVSTLEDGPADAALTAVLAHGAGARMEHPFMDHVAAGLAAGGIRVVRFNFAYAEAGRKSPDRQAVLEDTYRAVAEHVRADSGSLVLGGKSMGGRIASHIVASGYACDGLLYLGYPLHPPGKPERIRDRHLYEIKTPMLFVEGTRDPFCPLETLEGVRAKIPGPTEVAVIEDGDHSYRVRKSSGRDTAAAWDEVVQACSTWLATLS